MNDILSALYKSIILFVVLFILTRITGKKHLSQISYYDYISGITLGAIAGASSTNENARVTGAVIALIVWTLIPIIISYINMKSFSSKRFTGGKPLILIKNGTVIDENLKKARYTIEDLLMQLRKKDVFNLSEVEFAILETDGEVSVLKKSPYMPATPKDLNLPTPYKGLTIDLVVNGRIIESNMEFTDKDMVWLSNQLNQKKVNNLYDVIYAGLTSDGTLQVITRDNLNNSNGNQV